MAPVPPLAKLLQHIAACHSALLPGDRLPFRAGDKLIGYVKPGFAARLAAASPAVTLADGQAILAPGALGQLNALAEAVGCRFRDEDFDVVEAVDQPVLTVLDRGALPDFGVIGVGVHLNGLVRRGTCWHLWVGKRAADKKLDPGKLDHLVAGGVPAGMSRRDTLVKEGGEEASLPEAMIAQAVEVARFDYAMDRPEGLRRDAVFAYDLVLPDDFVPRPNDGEVESFELWPLERVLEVASSTNDFKFNVNLVIIDLLIRYGLIGGAEAARLRAALWPRAKAASPG